MEEHEVIANGGHVVRAVELGAGEPLVLCHGGSGWWDGFDALAGLLAARVRVIRWEQRGSGSLADLEALRAHLGLSRFALLGHAGGAEVALRYALANPELVSSLVAVSATGPREAPAGCRGLAVPTLLVDGAAAGAAGGAVDGGPGRGAAGPGSAPADVLADALPDVARVVLPGAGHVPWEASPGSFGWAVLAHLAR
ncbi:alpha/beta hydrolase [Saccharothrix sp. BKS2]|uniref:alpha/beta fold hydrolase n=1 Tax=Saccharothrix sp. BKS2 TaxID=3064400 RepID=UPI0039E9A1A3